MIGQTPLELACYSNMRMTLVEQTGESSDCSGGEPYTYNSDTVPCPSVPSPRIDPLSSSVIQNSIQLGPVIYSCLQICKSRVRVPALPDYYFTQLVHMKVKASSTNSVFRILASFPFLYCHPMMLSHS